MPRVKPLTDTKKLAKALRYTLLLTDNMMNAAILEGRASLSDPDNKSARHGMETVIQTAEELAGLVWSESEQRHIEIE